MSSDPHVTSRPESGAGALMLAAAGILLAALSLLLSFRGPFPDLELALAANLDRSLAAGAAGMALGVSAFLFQASGRRSPLFEPALFSLATGGAAGFVLGLKLADGFFAAIVLGLAGALLLAAPVRWLGAERRITNLGLLALLAIGLAVAVPAAVGADTEIARGGLALWLLGSAPPATGFGAAAALAASLFVCGAAAVRVGAAGDAPLGSEPLAIAALGLGVGIAGPIAFVGWFSAWLAARAAPGLGRPGLMLAALSGAALLMAADSVPRLLIGGYAPPLNVAVGLVAIPSFAWWNRARLRAVCTGRHSKAFEAVEILAIAGSATVFAYLVWQVTLYARAAT